MVKRARNPKRTSSQYSCTKTFVSPESGSFTTGRRVRTRDHYHQRDTLAQPHHHRTIVGVMIVDGRGGSRTERFSRRTCARDHEAQRVFKYPSIAADDTRRSFVYPILPFRSFLIAMGSRWEEEGEEEGEEEDGRLGKKGEKRRLPRASWWKMKENGSLTCLK